VEKKNALERFFHCLPHFLFILRMSLRRTSVDHTLSDDTDHSKSPSLEGTSPEKNGYGQPAESSGRVPQLEYDTTEAQVDKNEIPWVYRIIAFSMIVLFAFGSSFSESTFGPLKSTLVKELGITSESSGELGRCADLIRCAVRSHC
jgi:hypothetical protein